ncbi:NAD(P)H-quinone oxidoreductase subunit 4L chloroplastic [Bienertia sinuspersici]
MILEYVLVLSAFLFSIGIFGLVTSRNLVRALMCLELLLNAVNLNFVTFSDFFDSRQLKGNIFSIFVIAIAAAEAAIGWFLPKILCFLRQAFICKFFCSCYFASMVVFFL